MKIDVRELHPAERKVMAAGFAVGRRGGAAHECPHPIRYVRGNLVGRKGHLWVRGHVLGTAERERVRESYQVSATSLDGPQENCWGGTWGEPSTNDNRDNFWPNAVRG